MMMICIAPKWNNADKIRITISRIIGSSSIQAKWKIAQKESNYGAVHFKKRRKMSTLGDFFLGALLKMILWRPEIKVTEG